MNYKAIIGNPKTTTAAIAGLVLVGASVAHILLDGDPATTVDWTAVAGAASVCIGLLFGGDGDKGEPEGGE